MGKNLVCHQPVGSTGVGGNSGDPFTEWCDQLMNRSIGRYRPIGAFIAAIATIVVDDRPMHKLVTAFAEYYAAENPNVFQRAIPPPQLPILVFQKKRPGVSRSQIISHDLATASILSALG